MTKTIDRAAEVIARANLARRERRPHADVHIVTMQAAREYAHALAEAGLLSPDLPESNDDSLPLPTRSWELDGEGSPVVWSVPGGRVMIQRIEPGDLTPAQARTFALNVLAAANHAEGETND